MDPGFIRGYAFFAAACLHTGRHDEAIAAARRGDELSAGHHMMVVVLASVLGVAGRREEARATIAPVPGDQVQPMYAAMFHASVGDEEPMFAALERGVEERSDWMYSLGTQPWFRDWRAHPRFTALLERLHLAAGAAA
jgi:hypothetical protein